jgi:hypothetical protein
MCGGVDADADLYYRILNIVYEVRVNNMDAQRGQSSLRFSPFCCPTTTCDSMKIYYPEKVRLPRQHVEGPNIQLGDDDHVTIIFPG